MRAYLYGESVEGRKLEAYFLGTWAEGGLLLFGGIHGDEPDSAALCDRWFRARASSELADAVGAIVIPEANPDGLARRTKDNARGVDLNRNFDAHSFRAEYPPGYFPGSAPLSEPETRGLADLIARFSPAVIVSVHQPFRCVNWDGPAAALASRMSALTGYPAVASVGYPTPGSFGSAYGIDRGLQVITLELPRPMPEADYSGCLAAVDMARAACRAM